MSGPGLLLSCSESLRGSLLQELLGYPAASLAFAIIAPHGCIHSCAGFAIISTTYVSNNHNTSNMLSCTCSCSVCFK